MKYLYLLINAIFPNRYQEYRKELTNDNTRKHIARVVAYLFMFLIVFILFRFVFLNSVFNILKEL